MSKISPISKASTRQSDFVYAKEASNYYSDLGFRVSYLALLSCVYTLIISVGLQSMANSSQGAFNSTRAQHSFSQAGVCLPLTSTPALQKAAANAHRFEGFGKTGFHYHVYFMRYIVYSDEGFW